MIKILVVFGTRPEAIKMAPLCHALQADKGSFETAICVTGQHREMLDQVLELFEIKPSIDLNIMREKQDLTDVTTAVLSGMRNLFREFKPDLMLVHGDTTTTFAAATAAFYAGIPIGHVEAGLRTNDINAPFPEEFNRQIVSKLAKWHFAPTESSLANLLKEGLSKDDIKVTGNTVIDSLFWVLGRLESDPNRKKRIVKKLDQKLPFDWQKSKLILITGHRRENFGEGFLNICRAIAGLAEKYPCVNFVYPVHLNPNVQNPVNSLLNNVKNVHLISPLDYEPFVYLLQNCYLVLTDSGGIQEEAPSLGKPVLVMRDVTERPEAVYAGTVKLVGANYTEIMKEVSKLLDVKNNYLKMTRAQNPYGDGHACSRIIKIIKEALNAKI